MDKEQIKAIAEKADETATQYLQCAGEYHPDYNSVRDEHFANAAIESYKAELLNEVGEPGTWEFRTYNAETDEVIYHVTQSWLEAKHYDQFPMPLYTSEQVAAAILKATKPLEDQLSAAQEEIKTVTEQKNRMWFEMQTAQDQLAKAEQRVAEYNELIYAVQTKHHDETRHQTALRYIRNAENRQSYTAANGASS